MAQYNLALMLLQGDGIGKDEKQGMKWLQKAADNHHARALSVLNLIKNQN
jgi:TPR repeat protein